ncbi:MAG: helix-turn-helix transcriptional regulator [Clostridia bacterium]
MTFGDKLRKVRTYRGMTMKELGIAAGFPKSSADVRVAQYEADVRKPKGDIIDKFAFVLKVHPSYLATPEHTTHHIMHCLLSFDETNIINFEENSYTNVYGNPQKETFVTHILLQPYLAEWNNVKKALQKGEITMEQYIEWKMNWPKKPNWIEDEVSPFI